LYEASPEKKKRPLGRGDVRKKKKPEKEPCLGRLWKGQIRTSKKGLTTGR